ncbi:fibronectin type III domain-containing protein [Paenibacillus solani]|uniref:fibronectin type III domain-containing protein n=1 Tax=Paenibacillus solani TaxID=1705565 RepID=UPI003D2E35A6
MNKYTNNTQVLNKMFIPIITGVFFIVACFVMSNVVEASSKKKSIEEFVAEYSPPPEKIKNNKKNSKEISAKRNQFSKTFENTDNTYTTVISNIPQHYRAGGKWNEINTDILKDQSEAGFDLGVTENAYKTKLNKNSKKPIKISYENASVSYQAIGANSVTGKVVDNTIVYENMWENTDVSYTVNPAGVKMFILLKDKNSPKKFQFQIGVHNVTTKQNDDGSIDFIDSNGDVEFTIPPMWVKDASSEELRYEPLKVDISPSKKGSIITLRLDDSELEYPILIDPTTGVMKNYAREFSTGLHSLMNKNMPVSHIHQIILDVEVVSFRVVTGGHNSSWPSHPAGGDIGVYVSDADKKLIQVDTYPITAGWKSFRILGSSLRERYPQVKYISGAGVGDVPGDTYNGLEIVPSVTQLTITITYDVEGEDTIPPSAPTGLVVRSSTSTSANLIWNPSTDNLGVRQYKIYNDGIEIGSTDSNIPGYEVRGLQGGIVYNFSVKAVDGGGTLSWTSNTVSFTPDNVPPTKPGALTVTSVDSNSVAFSWSPSTDNVGIKLYKIYKDGSLLGSTTSTTYKATGLKDNTLHTFSVIAVDLSDNTSEPSILAVKTSGTYRYIYDENQRLISIVNGSGKTIKSFEYDRNGNLIKTIAHP